MLNILIADLFIINVLVEGVRIFDALPLRHLLAPRARTQQQMNERYATRNPLYLPYRWQLTCKFLLFGGTFSYGLPALYPITLLFFVISWHTDASGLLRVFSSITPTSEAMVLQARRARDT